MGAYERQGARDGFTLIELSIVLVIIGLIVGGVLTGRSLIRAAELRSIITDEQRYITAVNTFRTKYNEIPGDMADATNFWGTDPNGCPDDGEFSATPQTTTCNGNGNGLIESEGVNPSGGGILEGFRAWQQLADAGLIQGAYSGVPYSAGIPWSYMPGINVPATKIPNGGFAWMVFDNSDAQESSATWNAQVSVQYLLLGAVQSASGKLMQPLLTPMDAQAIDIKMDDGIAYTGVVLSIDGDGNCTAPAFSSTPAYNTSNGTPACTLLFQVKSW
jgi:prepilin-type N-terminal cleavage/methylation domain-containing protein